MTQDGLYAIDALVIEPLSGSSTTIGRVRR